MQIQQSHGKIISYSHVSSQTEIEIGSSWLSIIGDIVIIKDIIENVIEYSNEHNIHDSFFEDFVLFQLRYNKIL